MKLKRSCWRRKETTQGTDNLMRTLGIGSQGGTEERYKGDICSDPLEQQMWKTLTGIKQH